MATQSQGVSAPTVFQFQPSHEVRVFIIDGEPWFVAVDVCAALDLSNVTKALIRLDDDEKSQVIDPATLNSVQGTEINNLLNVINESGLYSLILTSRKPEAKKFKKWVTSEVLPAIRKTGRYVHPEATQPQPAPAPLGEIAQWVVGEYTRSLGCYLNRSTQQISPRIHTHLRAKFGVGNVRDIPADRLGEMLAILEAFHGQAYRLWWVFQGWEIALLQTLHVPVHETRRELPAIILQAMANVVKPKMDGLSMEASIRSKALERLAGQIPRQESLPLH